MVSGPLPGSGSCWQCRAVMGEPAGALAGSRCVAAGCILSALIWRQGVTRPPARRGNADRFWPPSSVSRADCCQCHSMNGVCVVQC